MPRLRVLDGKPLPLGATGRGEAVNFALFSENATAVFLLIFDGGDDPVAELRLEPPRHRTGYVWHVAIEGLPESFEYAFRVDGPTDGTHRFNPSVLLLDPYARAIHRRPDRKGTGSRRSLFLPQRPQVNRLLRPRIPVEEKIIYEMHVRGFTRHPSSGVQFPGTYRGAIEKIPYLKELGVTTVELLPVYEYDESHLDGQTGGASAAKLRNYWGYDPIGFFAPTEIYSASGSPVSELRALVRALHSAGIEVFLDVVFNHTAESKGSPKDPTYSFRGIDNAVYYMIDPRTGRYLDFSGCGNTLNPNHTVVRDLIVEALRYWAMEFDIDGFRFDLASVLTRGAEGEVLVNPPLIERIEQDPVLADLTLIAEAWDASGLYQVGNFPIWGRWSEWNDRFRDDVRQFVRGDPGFTGKLASRLAGSSDLYSRPRKGHPCHSINFVTAHDGFTLRDLVSYDRKHNEANGEKNRDGASENYSSNCGVEGDTDDPSIVALRRQLMKNFLAILFVSQGVPMLLAGDEMGRTQRGNNNAWCQDNEVSWIDWSLLRENADLFRFARLLIAFRKAHPVIRRTRFLTGAPTGPRRHPDVTWHGVRLGEPDWGPHSRALAMHLAGEHAAAPDCDVYFAASSWSGELRFELPEPPGGSRWRLVADTARAAPGDIYEAETEPLVEAPSFAVQPRSCVLLRSDAGR